MQDEPKNYYEILELTPQAKPEDIKRAYFRLARKYHPDHNENNKSNATIMAELNHVYEVLANPQKRQEYDKRFIPPKVYDFSKPKAEENKAPIEHRPVYQARESSLVARYWTKYWKEVLAILVVILMLYAMGYLIIRIINMNAKLPA